MKTPQQNNPPSFATPTMGTNIKDKWIDLKSSYKLDDIGDSNTKKEYLETHLRYRLRAVDGLCAMLLTEHDIDELIYCAVFDAGLIHLRALYSLLEIKSHRHQDVLSNFQPDLKDKDIKLSDLNANISLVKPLSISNIPTLIRSISSIKDTDHTIKENVARILRIASQTTAHLVARNRPIKSNYFYYTAIILLGAVKDRIYDSQQITCADFDTWTIKLLTPIEKEEHDKKVDVVMKEAARLR